MLFQVKSIYLHKNSDAIYLALVYNFYFTQYHIIFIFPVILPQEVTVQQVEVK